MRRDGGSSFWIGRPGTRVGTLREKRWKRAPARPESSNVFMSSVCFV